LLCKISDNAIVFITMATMTLVLAQICLLLVLAPTEEPERPPFVREYLYELFAAHEHVITAPGAEVERIPYRLFVPPAASAKEPAPLVIWLHGGNERGNDNMSQLRWLELMLTSKRLEGTNFFVLAPQCVPLYDRWYDKPGGRGKRPDMCDFTFEIVEDLISSEPIDPHRIYVMGVSYGGASCWEFAMRSPFPIAAIAPMSTGGKVDRDNLSRLHNIPIWAFSPKTETQSVEQVRELVQIVKDQGGNARLTETSGNTHDSWSEAFLTYDIMEWLLEQHADAYHWRSWANPKTWLQSLHNFGRQWSWPQAIVQLLLILVVVWILGRFYHLLRRHSAAQSLTHAAAADSNAHRDMSPHSARPSKDRDNSTSSQ
jgi:predicted peptidase